MEQHQQQSNELIRWLQMLSLPLWLRVLLMAIMLCVISGGLLLVGYGVWEHDTEPIVSGVTLLTITTPILLIVVALVFTPRGAKKLQEITTRLLTRDIPDALAAHTQTDPQCKLVLSTLVNGCVADYTASCKHTEGKLRFRVELNVYKVNVVLWIPKLKFPSDQQYKLEFLDAIYGESLKGARHEGYTINPHLRTSDNGMPDHCGLILLKKLDSDFLLKPVEQLYFMQDLAFFIHSVMAIERRSHEAE